MSETAQILAFLSALLLAASVAIWAKLRGPLLQRLDGTRASNAAPAELVTQVLVAAFGVAVLAAVLAVIGWIIP
jgi:hypothetical protein